MLARLLLALLLVLGAAPAAAMPAGCHDAPAMSAVAMAASDHRPHQAPVRADHSCIGCATPADLTGGPIATPLPAPAMVPIVTPTRLKLGAASPPMLRPPRIG